MSVTKTKFGTSSTEKKQSKKKKRAPRLIGLEGRVTVVVGLHATMSSTNHSVYDAISPPRHVARIVSLQTLPQRGISPLVIPGGTIRASMLPLELAHAHGERSRSALRSPSVPTTHPSPRGGATPNEQAIRGGGFTDLRLSPAQRRKGTYGDGYCTIGRGLMRNLHDAEDAQATGYATRPLPPLQYSQHLKKTVEPRYHLTSDDYVRVFMDSPAHG